MRHILWLSAGLGHVSGNATSCVARLYCVTYDVPGVSPAYGLIHPCGNCLSAKLALCDTLGVKYVFLIFLW